MKQTIFSILLIFSFIIYIKGLNAQCTKDIECKGDRICVKGTCVFPYELKLKKRKIHKKRIKLIKRKKQKKVNKKPKLILYPINKKEYTDGTFIYRFENYNLIYTDVGYVLVAEGHFECSSSQKCGNMYGGGIYIIKSPKSKNENIMFVMDSIVYTKGSGDITGYDYKNGIFYVKELLYKNSDPMCCPSKKSMEKFKIINGKFVKVK